MSAGLPPGARLMGFGFFVAVSIGGGVYLGHLLDQQVGLSPLFTLLGLFLGLIIAGLGVMRLVQETNAESER